MATVDLDKLAAELTAAGIEFTDTTNHFGRLLNFDAGGFYFNIYGDGFTYPLASAALDIIIRHVAPPAPDPALRERIAKAVKSVDHSELVELGYVDAITNAVMAVIAGQVAGS